VEPAYISEEGKVVRKTGKKGHLESGDMRRTLEPGQP